MSTSPTVIINPDERFPHLKNASIVEAGIDLRARAESDWNEQEITEALKKLLPDYPKKLSMSGFQQELTFGPGIVPEGKTTEKGWTGVRCQTEDGLHVAQFNRDGFMFARLRPYQQWDRLVADALRLWTVFVDVAKPAEIQRMGVRFINRINPPPRQVRIQDYMDPGPQGSRELDLPFKHFFLLHTFPLTGHPST